MKEINELKPNAKGRYRVSLDLSVKEMEELDEMVKQTHRVTRSEVARNALSFLKFLVNLYRRGGRIIAYRDGRETEPIFFPLQNCLQARDSQHNLTLSSQPFQRPRKLYNSFICITHLL